MNNDDFSKEEEKKESKDNTILKSKYGQCRELRDKMLQREFKV